VWTVRILDVTEFFSERGGGVRSHLAAKGRALAALGHEHVVAAPGRPDGEQPILPSRLVRLGGPRTPYDPTYHVLLNPFPVRAAVRRERPDVLELHSPYVGALGALSCARPLFGIRTFFWHSDFIDMYRQVLLEKERLGMRLPAPLQRAVTEPLWAWVRRIGKGCDATLAGARWQVDKLRSRGVVRVRQQPFGVDKRIFQPGPASEAVRARYGVQPGERMLVGVGRFAVEKRWEVVVEAFLSVRERLEARLVLFGDGPERPKLEALAGKGGAVQFAGFVQDRAVIAEALRSADALVHGCPHETFGLSIAEAVCCGLPVVVPDLGGACEQAGPHYAEVYESGDAAACAAALVRLCGREQAALRAAAREAAGQVASEAESFERLLGIYRELLEERGCRAGAEQR
jgi:alpha-1,6-mannosyltransferase